MPNFLRTFSSILEVTFFLFNILSCSPGKRGNGKSESVLESKRRGVFIKELLIDPEIIVEDDDNHLKVKTAFFL